MKTPNPLLTLFSLLALSSHTLADCDVETASLYGWEVGTTYNNDYNDYNDYCYTQPAGVWTFSYLTRLAVGDTGGNHYFFLFDDSCKLVEIYQPQPTCGPLTWKFKHDELDFEIWVTNGHFGVGDASVTFEYGTGEYTMEGDHYCNDKHTVVGAGRVCQRAFQHNGDDWWGD